MPLSTPRRSALLIAVAAATLVGLPSPVGAAPAEDVVSWDVSPANASGPDGRSRVETELDPGETVTDYLALSNLGDTSVTFSLTAADGYLTPAGRFNMLPSDTESTGSGTWITVQETIEVVAGGVAVVPFEISVPDDATPGDHAAGIAGSIFSTGTAEDGTRLGVESRVGFRVLTRVVGVVAPELELSGVTGGYVTSWNPFEAGRVDLDFLAQNPGNITVATSAMASSGDRSGHAWAEGSTELLPGDSRQGEARIDGIWPLGPTTVTVRLEAEAQGPDGSPVAVSPVSTEVVVWAIPWPHLLLLLALALITTGLLWGRRRRRDKTDRMLATAREEGRREAEHQNASRYAERQPVPDVDGPPEPF